jgi:hypothetical protein
MKKILDHLIDESSTRGPCLSGLFTFRARRHLSGLFTFRARGAYAGAKRKQSDTLFQGSALHLTI